MRNLKVGDLVTYKHADPGYGSLVVISEGENHPISDYEYGNTYIWVMPLDPSLHSEWEDNHTSGFRFNGIQEDQLIKVEEEIPFS